MTSFTQGLNMQSLMSSDDYVNNTDKIRQLKHSEDILLDIAKICELKKTHGKIKIVEEEKFKHLCQTSCPFLYANYTDIFNKVVNDELNLHMMVDFVKMLKQIEEGQIDQFEASVKIGTILRDMYVDSAIKRGEKLDAANGVEDKKFVEPKKLTWAEWNKKKN